jgi:hypothetical protein
LFTLQSRFQSNTLRWRLVKEANLIEPGTERSGSGRGPVNFGGPEILKGLGWQIQTIFFSGFFSGFSLGSVFAEKIEFSW